ncbi:hypothetical protein EGI32_13520 [Ferruginibacter sp. HRS2-29]|nr:hypothetical protein [Ferruginibacter sp. HRS2-29]
MLPCSALFAQTQTFATPGTYTFTVPVGVFSINVSAWGAGGAGGGVNGLTRAGGGGEGGSFVRGTMAVIPGATYTVVVGTGGTGALNATGTAGGASSFSVSGGGATLYSAIGGGGGAVGASFGAGGNTANTGNIVTGTSQITFYGGNGGTATNASSASSGGGGGSAGAGGNGGNGGVVTGGTAGAAGTPADPGIAGATGRGSANDGNGNNGSAPGAGGSGGRNANDATDYRGGNGGNGQVKITYAALTYKATISSFNGGGSANWCAGETRNVSVLITNTGTATWTDGTGGYPNIRVGVKWNTNGANWTDYHVRVGAGNLAPGASATITLPITASNNAGAGYTTTLAAGSNNLIFDVVYEGVSWFGDNAGGVGPGNVKFTSPAQTIIAAPATPGGNTVQSFCGASAPTVANLVATGTTIKWYAAASGGTALATSTPLVDGAHYFATQTNGSGCESATRLDVTVSLATSITSLTYASNPAVYCPGAAITANNPIVGGGTPASYSVSPALPNGLTLNTSTGVISGNPTTTTPAADYTVTATNACGSFPVNVNITILPAAPTGLSYAELTPSYCVGTAITNNTPSNSGGAATGYSVTPALPSGLSLDPSTGVISGTPLGASPATNYTVTASNSCGSAPRVINITVTTPPLSISYATTTAVYCPNVAITANNVSFTGGAPTNYSVSPALPAGLSINATTGAISGTPTAATAAANYTITGSNTCGSQQAVVNITISPAAPTALNYSGNTAVYCQNTLITNNTPSSTGGAPTSYSVSPALPAGLSLDVNTGVISGTPTVLSAAANYTVTATNSCGFTTRAVNITVTTVASLTYSAPTAVYCLNVTIANNTATNSGGASTSYAISPALPAGLSFNTANGTISGTPTAASAAANYTITATNSCGVSSGTVVNITVNAQTISLTSGNSTQSVCQNAPLVNITYNVGGSAVNASATGLPTGITGSYSAGVFTISGSTNVAAGAYPFTVTTSGTCNAATATGTITVNPLPNNPTTPVNLSICPNGSGNISVSSPSTGSLVVTFNAASQPAETNSAPGNVVATATMPALPTGATMTLATLDYDNLTALSGSWRSDIRLGFSGAVNNSAATGTGAPNSAGTFDYTRAVSLASINPAGGTVNLLYWDNINDRAGADANFNTPSSATLTINYTLPATTVRWYDAATNGTLLGTGNTFNPVGTSVLPNTATPGTYNFYAEAAYATGCGSAARQLVTVTVNPNPSVVITNPPAVCSPATVNLTLAAVTAGSTAGLTYTYWTNAAATTAYGTPTAATNGTYYIKGTTAAGCFDIKPVVVTVNQAATAAAGANTNVCQSSTPGAITLSGSSVGGSATTGQWSIVSGGGTLSNTTFQANAGIATTTYTPAAGFTGTVTLRLTTNNPGTACGPVSDDKLVIVDAAHTVSAGGPDVVCQAGSFTPITLSGATVGGGATRARWSAPVGTFSNNGNPSAYSTTPNTETYLPPSNYTGTITLTLTTESNSSCAVATATRTIVVNQAATVNPGPQNTVCQSATPAAITLTGASFGGAATSATWAIISGGGTLSNTSATTTPATVTYTPAANYTGLVVLSLTATDPDGSGPCSTVSATRTIYVSPAPTITSLTATPATICAGGTTNLVVVAPAPPSATLISDNFNGVLSFIPTGSVTGFNFGSIFTVRNSPYTPPLDGALSSPDNSKYIIADEAVVFSGGTSSQLTSASINTNGYSSLSLAFQYSYDNGGITGSSATVEISRNGGAWTTVQTLGTNSGFANATVDLTTAINVTDLKVRFNYTASSFLVGYSHLALDNVNLTGVVAPLAYAWTASPAGATSGLNAGHAASSAANANITIAPTATTTYTVTQSNGQGCTSTAQVTVTVNQPSVAPAGAAASPQTICLGQSTTLTKTGAGSLGTGATWHWYAGPGFTTPVGTSSAPDASLTVTPSGTTTYYVRAEGGTAPCAANTAAASVTVTVNIPSIAPTGAVATPTTICAGSSSILTQTGGTLGTGATWRWYTDPGFNTLAGSSVAPDASLTVSPSGNTTYYVRAEAGTAPCSTGNTTGASTTVTVNAAATAGIAGATTICAGSSANITITATPNTTVGYQVNGAGPVLTIAVNGTGTATLVTGPLAGTTTYHLVNVGYTATPACTQTVTGSVTITVNPAGTWLGITSNWHDANNWCGGMIPTNATSVNIPVMMPGLFYPVISGPASAHNITTAAGATITLNNTTLDVYGSIISTNGINAIDGHVTFKGSTTQTVAGSMFVAKQIRDLTIDNNVNVTGSDTLKISATLDFGSPAGGRTFAAGTSNVVLLSSLTRTANVPDIGNNAITGTKFTVERFINTGTATVGNPLAHGRTWQLLSVPTNSAQTVNNAWQEGQGANVNGLPGYGTLLNGPGAQGGYDNNSAGTYIKVYYPNIDQWSLGTNPTTTPIATNRGWMTFVLGDRSSTPTQAKPTVLRTTGSLFTGTQPAITIQANKYDVVGNPYPSEIDLRQLILPGSNLTDEVYVWDPSLGAGFGFGRYVTLTKIGSDYEAVPPSPMYPGIVNTIQSGQAFFVKSNGQGPSSVTFTEAAKANANRVVTRGGNGANETMRINLSIGAATATKTLLDGAIAIFDDQYITAVDRFDGLKLINSGENAGFKTAGRSLAVDRRPSPVTADTLYVEMTAMKVQSYSWEVIASNMTRPGRSAWLLDNFLGTRTPLSLEGSTIVNFDVTSAAPSAAANRFSIIFSKVTAPLPVTITSISATRNSDRSIAVKWSVENELNIDRYEVERSADGIHFTGILTAASTNSRNYAKDDLSPLSKDNFYRIKATSVSGQVQYSAIVKVAPVKTISSISVYPNPVEGKIVNLRFTDMPSGNYQLQLANNLGQIVYSGTATVNAMNFVKNITLGKTVTAGSYQLRVVDAAGHATDIQLIIQ